MDHLSDQMATFGYYGLDTRPDALAEFYSSMIEWMQNRSLTPTLLGTSDSPRYKKFRPASIKKMQDRICRITHLSLVSLPADVDNEFLGENCYASLSPKDMNRGYTVFSMKERLLPLSSPDFRDLMVRLAKLVRPSYGFAFRREFRYGPTYFAMAMRYGEATERDRVILRNHNANLQYGYYKSKGVLTSLFPYNMLTDAQLLRTVGNMTLEEWIRSSPEHGELSPLTDSMKLWQLSDEQIERLIPVLQKAGRIIDPDHEWDLRIKESEARGIPKPTPEEALAAITQAFGFDDPDQVDIVQHDKPGKSRPLSDDEKKAVFKKQPKRKTQ